jgi:hypothetical protein
MRIKVGNLVLREATKQWSSPSLPDIAPHDARNIK